MNPAAASVGDLVQHATVTAVALGALGVVLRRVFGVFGKHPAPAAGAGSAGVPGAPACSHCASGPRSGRDRSPGGPTAS